MSELARALRTMADAAAGKPCIDGYVSGEVENLLRSAARAIEKDDAYARDDERRAWDLYVSGIVTDPDITSSKDAAQFADCLLERRRERWPREGGGDAPKIKGAGSPCKQCGACMDCESCEGYATMCDAAADVLSEALGLEVQRHGVLEGVNMLAGRMKARGRGLAVEPQHWPGDVNR